MTREAGLHRSMVAIAREMYARRFVAATEGNLSARLDAKRLLVTPTSVSKGRLTENQLIVTDLTGRVLKGRTSPSSEIGLHLTVYRLRPDVNAVIHGHPPIATAFTVAGIDLAQRSLPEIVMNFGAIPVAPYATPTTPEVGRSIEPYVGGSDAILLSGHGSLTVGRTLLEAFENLERVEWTAEVSAWARLLGEVRPLPAPQLDKLLALHRKLHPR